MNKEVYWIFWYLSLGDIRVEEEYYADSVKEIESNVKALNKEIQEINDFISKLY